MSRTTRNNAQHWKWTKDDCQISGPQGRARDSLQSVRRIGLNVSWAGARRKRDQYGLVHTAEHRQPRAGTLWQIGAIVDRGASVNGFESPFGGPGGVSSWRLATIKQPDGGGGEGCHSCLACVLSPRQQRETADNREEDARGLGDRRHKCLEMVLWVVADSDNRFAVGADAGRIPKRPAA
jgi:hypothetical protein